VTAVSSYHLLQFEAEIDDLGEAVWCPVRLGSGVAVLLNRYAGSPDEVTVWGPDSLTSEQVASAFGIPLKTQHDPAAKAYYERKRAEGKGHNAAVICVARRRCDLILAMLTNGQAYDPHRSENLAKAA
jgi:hypothetical protein